MFKQFDKSTFTSYFFIFFFYLLVVYKFFINLSIEYTNSINFSINVNNKWIHTLFFAILIAFITIRINKIISSLKIFSSNNNLTSFLFLFFVTLWLIKSPSIYDLLVLIQAYYCIEIFNNSLHKESTIENYFKLGIFISAIFILMQVNILFILPTLVSFTIIGKKGIKDFLAYLVGLLMPIYLISSYSLITDDTLLIQNLFSFTDKFRFELIQKYDIYVISIFIFSILMALPRISILNINTRMLMSSIISLAIILIAFMLFFNFIGCKMVGGLVIVSTMYASIFINFIKNKKQRDALIILSIILGIINIFVL